MARALNFSAGPAPLPTAVLQRIANEIDNYDGLGMGLMELSHRSSSFVDLLARVKASLRVLMAIPANYEVLFLQGGATSQFAAIPLNLAHRYRRVGFIDTGNWSRKAIAEADRFVETRVLASGAEQDYRTLPDLSDLDLREPLDYLHLTTNNTIRGTRFHDLPEVGNLPLVADISSHILGEEIDISRFGLVYAGAQKNLGPAGVTVVIVREDLLGTCLPGTPTMLNYAIHAQANSAYNTPPTFAIYAMGLVLDWVREQGGVQVMAAINRQKAELLYGALDRSSLFESQVDRAYRSVMNVPFHLPDERLTQTFLKEADDRDMFHLKGHKSVGGLRASLYNAVPLEAVERLVVFIKDFEANHR